MRGSRVKAERKAEDLSYKEYKPGRKHGKLYKFMYHPVGKWPTWIAWKKQRP